VSAPDHRPLSAQTGPPQPHERAWARVPFYPVLVGFALIAGTYVQRDISLGAVVRTMAIAALLGVLLTVVFAAATRRWQAGALLAAVTLVVLHAGDLPHAAGAVVLAVLITVLLFYLSRLRGWRFLPGATRVLNILATALVVVLGVQGVLAGVAGRVLAEAGIASDPATKTSEAAALPTMPDIYFLMLEDYPRADSLERLFGFDNAQFLADLQTRGFSVATDSRASYMHTDLNVTSLFHMAYLDDLPKMQAFEAGQASAPSLRLLINGNPVFDRLHGDGYTIFSSAGRWEGESVRSADVFCGGDQINEFEYATLRDSLIGVALDAVVPGWRSARDRSLVNAELSCVESASRAAVSGPRFVWGHIEAPHPPVVFSASGGAAPFSIYGDVEPGSGGGSSPFGRAYVDQLRYLNGRVLQLVDEIQRNSPKPPVIVVMSDEGYDVAAAGTLPDRFGTLFAASTPDHGALFGAQPLTVNVFTNLFNAYFGTTLPSEPPRYFKSPDDRSLHLQEIPDPFSSAVPGS